MVLWIVIFVVKFISVVIKIYIVNVVVIKVIGVIML